MGMGDVEVQRTSKKFLIVHEHWHLLMELCHFTESLNPVWQTQYIQQQLKDLSHGIIEETAGLKSDEDKLLRLVQYFFDDLGFKIDEVKPQLSQCFLPEVLRLKKGPAVLLMLLITTLFEECQLKIQITSCRRRYLLRIELYNKSHILDFADRCRFLEANEIVDLINQDFDFASGSLNKNNLIIDYLKIIQDLARQENKLHILTLTHSFLMRYQPFNLKHITERAVVAYETGNYRKAIDDIRSYFQYKQPEFTNNQLKKIYKLALRKEQSRQTE